MALVVFTEFCVIRYNTQNVKRITFYVIIEKTPPWFYRVISERDLGALKGYSHGVLREIVLIAASEVIYGAPNSFLP